MLAHKMIEVPSPGRVLKRSPKQPDITGMTSRAESHHFLASFRSCRWHIHWNRPAWIKADDFSAKLPMDFGEPIRRNDDSFQIVPLMT